MVNLALLLKPSTTPEDNPGLLKVEGCVICRIAHILFLLEDQKPGERLRLCTSAGVQASAAPPD